MCRYLLSEKIPYISWVFSCTFRYKKIAFQSFEITLSILLHRNHKILHFHKIILFSFCRYWNFCSFRFDFVLFLVMSFNDSFFCFISFFFYFVFVVFCFSFIDVQCLYLWFKDFLIRSLWSFFVFWSSFFKDSAFGLKTLSMGLNFGFNL